MTDFNRVETMQGILPHERLLESAELARIQNAYCMNCQSYSDRQCRYSTLCKFTFMGVLPFFIANHPAVIYRLRYFYIEESCQPTDFIFIGSCRIKLLIFSISVCTHLLFFWKNHRKLPASLLNQSQ